MAAVAQPGATTVVQQSAGGNPWAGPPEGENVFGMITQNVSRLTEAKPPRAWYVAFAIALALLTMFGLSLAYLFYTGIGVWGNMVPVAWCFDIVNFVFWVGIGHAGTLISAILYLLRQDWRTAINRAAEAMTIFAVVCAAIFPGIHIGRPWLPYWMFPIPNQMGMWPQFRSPLEWDVFAVGTYATVSLLFWYMGMIPDFATFRDRSTTKIRRIAYGIVAMGWRGSSRQWHRYERAYLLLAALATPLVLSVHSVVSFDFATSQLPGWHTTIFPPYFVAGAIFGGFAMVVTLLVPARQFFGLKYIITLRHIELMTKVILGTGMLVGYAYGMEFFIAWYSGSLYEGFTFINRLFGPYAWAYWTMIFCNVVAPQIFWSRKMRRNVWVAFAVGVIVNVGMWFERFVIIGTSLARDFLPSSWGYYVPTPTDYTTLGGSFGLFFTLFLLFCRYLPTVAMAEVKAIMPEAHVQHGHGGAH
ncbi:MAG: polysulfide reductase NrfD [Polyangiaceae bacterium]|nr:polysulfide reductase NrfD [Polyangiaceae bacterium]